MNSGSWNLSPPVFSFKIFHLVIHFLYIIQKSALFDVCMGEKDQLFLFHQSISCIGDFLHIHSSFDFVVFQCLLLIPQLHFWMSLICRRFFFYHCQSFFWRAHHTDLSFFFPLVITILSLGGNTVTVDENVDAQAVNSQAFNGRNVTL